MSETKTVMVRALCGVDDEGNFGVCGWKGATIDEMWSGAFDSLSGDQHLGYLLEAEVEIPTMKTLKAVVTKIRPADPIEQDT